MPATTRSTSFFPRSVPRPARRPARRAATAASALAALSLLLAGLTAPTAQADPPGGPPAISPDDAATVGWATQGGGTDGGAGAPAGSVSVVTDRAELLAALDNGGRRDEPKVVYVRGTIHGNEAADGRLLGEQDYAPGYDLDKYLSCFGDEGWSDALHDYCGAQRRLRTTGSNNLKRQIEISVPSNTTLLGLGDDAGFDAATLMLHLSHDVVIRNLTLEAPVDHFTSWDPWDGELGAWNARFDAMSSVTSTNVWVDHVTFTDGRFPDSAAPTGPNGRPVNFHDGLFDVKDGSDLITVSNSRFTDHDKTLLIGSGDDNADTDAGRLRMTFVGNAFEGICQRAPRVRYGQVHVLNNWYRGSSRDPVSPVTGDHCYGIGLGIESSVVSEGNAFDYTGPGTGPGMAVSNWNATRFSDSGSWFRGSAVDLDDVVTDGTAGPVGPAGWDPADVYPYAPLDGYAAVKHHGKHGTGAGVLEVARP